MKLTTREILLAGVLALFGFVFTLRPFLLFMAEQNPLIGFVIYEVILYGSLLALSRFDLVIFGIKIKNIQQVLGVFLITFAFFIVVDWTSAYVQYATTGSFGGVSPVYLQSEDGVVWWIYSSIIQPTSAGAIEFLRILTYVVTPALLALLGGLLASKKPKF